jgi:hypothetical protein
MNWAMNSVCGVHLTTASLNSPEPEALEYRDAAPDE